MYLRRIVDKLMPDDRFSEEDLALRRFIFSLLIIGQPLLIVWSVLWAMVGFHVGCAAAVAMFFAQTAMIAMMHFGMSPQVIGHLYSFSIYITLLAISFGSGGIRSPLCSWYFIPVVNAFWICGGRAGVVWGLIVIAGLCGLWLAETSGVPMTLEIPAHLTNVVHLGSAVGIVFYFSVVAGIYHRWRRDGMSASKGLMEQRQHLVSVLGHDLKNPVSGLLGRVYLIERELGKGKPVDFQQMLVFVRDEGSKILESVDRLLLLNRSKMVVEVPKMKSLDLRATIDKVIEEHLPWMKGKDIHTDLSKLTTHTVYGDENMLIRLFDNILTNSIKYSHAGSVIRFEATPKLESSRSMVEITVADEGVGMDPREADQFFKLDYRPNRPTAGESSSGVGAAIMREIVAAHDGRIWLTTEGKNKGTKVHILLRAPQRTTTATSPSGAPFR